MLIQERGNNTEIRENMNIRTTQYYLKCAKIFSL